MLQRGAARVAAVDVADGQIAQSMRDDTRVAVIERLNAREMLPSDLPFAAVLRVRSTSPSSRWRRCCPLSSPCLAPRADLLAMVKPQFELGRKRVGRGVVRDQGDRREAVLAVAEAASRARARRARLRALGPSGAEGQHRDLRLVRAARARASRTWASAIEEVDA